MLFNSAGFVIFFFVVLVLWQFPLSWTVRKFILVLASYYFYACWNPPFILLLWLSTIMDWFLAKGLYALRESRARRFFLLLSLMMNLGLLGFFKYGNFLIENFQALAGIFGIGIFENTRLNVILPVGISFYTFQTLSYTLDVYMGKRAPAKSFLEYALYIAFFPQLVAGPIVRAETFLPQLETPRAASRAQFHWGLSLMVLGLFEKMVIADYLMAPVSERIFLSGVSPGFRDAWAGTLAFSTQIFCDFAGYSTCAIGTALCFGFTLTRNFNFPFAAVGFSDYWRRWHISLSTWLRDYLYIPLGGSRLGTVVTYRNLMVTMILGGLWHGASWTFVVWGGLHGLYLCAERYLKSLMLPKFLFSGKAARFLLGALTFAGVSLAWVFFRSPDLGFAWHMVRVMTGFDSGTEAYLLSRFQTSMVFAVTGAAVTLHAALRRSSLKRAAVKTPAVFRAAALLVMVVLIWCTAGEDRAFIYFQF